MDERVKRRYSYLVASVPLVISGLQVLLGSAPVIMLAFGAAMAVVAIVLFRFLSGIRLFKPGQLHFGKTRALPAWQAPALWVPVIVTVGTVIFFWLVR
ncbi:hypothetical protein RHOFW510R12_39760 [Rhodanobacter sp. FW510-R12]|uniref:hypothetical protein n=1 Tax=unclassified Rhodanobacter TaxID=2621553 RepID=UPI0007A9964C|nr:hypothetical protein RHOFW104R8_00055 [Rhodanobacter sp. FW104-R8]KZC26967.1 hypothetical protein RhoFW510T8_00035 [Rhodanobacter sp. FW510-T8]KZC31344.1 hypothetical protein RhoFW510R10_00030 [Rhodanobacter sp. FW510-R10]